jgi:hypothetical protein
MEDDIPTAMVECPDCEAVVQAAPARPWLQHELDRIGILQCPRCYRPLVVFQRFLGPVGPYEQEEYGTAERVWPVPAGVLPHEIPEIIHSSLTEAQKCLACGTYTASVAMTGRGLEGLCRHFKTSKLSLFEGLKELLTRKIIDDRLYEWADELRDHRNLAAHASGASFSRQDAQDIFDFAVAICDYIFVLSKKFEEFQQRISSRSETKGQ